jgi:hypothetical protein
MTTGLSVPFVSIVIVWILGDVHGHWYPDFPVEEEDEPRGA